MRSLTTNFNTLGNEITLATYSCKTILVRIPDGNTGIGAHMLNRKYDLPKAFVFRSKAVDNFKFILKIVFLHRCAKCSELPSIISTARKGLMRKFFVNSDGRQFSRNSICIWWLQNCFHASDLRCFFSLRYGMNQNTLQSHICSA